jgi:uncharacterized protein GlcG (DUF336 family)
VATQEKPHSRRTACAKQGYKVSATVIDPEGIRIAMLRGDGAGVHTIDAAYAKAFAALSFAAPILGLDTSGQLGELFAKQPNFQPELTIAAAFNHTFASAATSGMGQKR